MGDTPRGIGDLLNYVEKLHARIRTLMAENSKLKEKLRALTPQEPKSTSKKRQR